MKRIIFDLDNTLIPWKDNYWVALEKTFKYYEIDISILDILEVEKQIDKYEEKYPYYDKKWMHDLIEKSLNGKIKIPALFVDTWLEYLKECAEPIKEVIDTLEYLKKHYDLVVLTNWFTDSQIGRLKTANILNYFTKVYGAEKYMKPSSDSYIYACGDYLLKDCIMIGDDIIKDVEAPSNLGIKSIFLNIKNIKNDKYKQITKLSELKDIL